MLWLEEAHALTEYQWKILEPTIRKGFGMLVHIQPRTCY